MRTAVFSAALGLSLMTLASSGVAQPRVANSGVVAPVPVAAPALTPDVVVARQEALFARLKPDTARQLEKAAREYIARVERAPTPRAPQKSPLEHARDLARALPAHAFVGSLEAGDIEATAHLIMLQAARDAEQDLKALLVDMKQTHQTKESLRKFLAYRRAVLAGAAPVKPAGTDSLSELTEMQSLRLQMAMDRLSKMMETLSNILKKIADTQQAVVQNMK